MLFIQIYNKDHSVTFTDVPNVELPKDAYARMKELTSNGEVTWEAGQYGVFEHIDGCAVKDLPPGAHMFAETEELSQMWCEAWYACDCINHASYSAKISAVVETYYEYGHLGDDFTKLDHRVGMPVRLYELANEVLEERDYQIGHCTENTIIE